MLKSIFRSVVAAALLSAAIHISAPAQDRFINESRRSLTLIQNRAPEPFVVEYYYTTKWGYADEFLRLFKKNHYPVLKKQVESGRILNVRMEKPRYHATEDGRWDYKVTITFKSAAAFHEPSGEEAIIKQLYPDQETFKREEQRRFEILLAHWDVPLTGVPLDQ